MIVFDKSLLILAGLENKLITKRSPIRKKQLSINRTPYCVADYGMQDFSIAYEHIYVLDADI